MEAAETELGPSQWEIYFLSRSHRGVGGTADPSFILSPSSLEELFQKGPETWAILFTDQKNPNPYFESH